MSSILHNDSELKSLLEAILFVSGEPLSTKYLGEQLGYSRRDIMKMLDFLSGEYEKDNRGIRLIFMDDMVQMSSNPKHAQTIEDILAPIRIQSLTRTAVEVLSIVAYKQPITRTEIAEIRGIRSDYTIKALVKKGLIEERGKKDALGHPAMYATTPIFLRDFNLSDLSKLPHLGNSTEEQDI